MGAAIGVFGLGVMGRSLALQLAEKGVAVAAYDPWLEARDEAVRAGVTINGLPILALEPDLEEYYRDNVIGGPGAFVIPTASFETFADAILKKLVIEISDAGGVKDLPLPILLQNGVRGGDVRRSKLLPLTPALSP